MRTIVSVCSARPNFVKLAAVHHALKKRPEIAHVIVHTGQHYDPLFSDIFFEQLSIPQPDHNLEIHGGTREEVIARTEEAFARLLPDIKPDFVLVYGDVNGAVGAARAAKKHGAKIAHVEAGLRSFDVHMPEELNRIEIDGLADLLLCSEESGMKNIREEDLRGRAELVGNTMIDTLVRMMPVIETTPLPVVVGVPHCVATLHRPSNVDHAESLAMNLRFLGEVATLCPVVLPAHHRLKAAVEKFSLGSLLTDRIRFVEPLGYLPFLRLVMESEFVLTDSGGIQEEAVLLRKKCFTLRRNTERPSTLESGSNVLIDPAKPEDAERVLAFARAPGGADITVPELWDGKAGERIVAVLLAA